MAAILKSLVTGVLTEEAQRQYLFWENKLNEAAKRGPGYNGNIIVQVTGQREPLQPAVLDKLKHEFEYAGWKLVRVYDPRDGDYLKLS